ncbi:RelA/SpoT domain-containing protein [Aquimarina intermedia]|uniref:RelA/SpoT family protein n=1 Tax=Aquimarina intermedia TaxID=350814 RepID=A0A5S5C758_9FLAO|nr:RelA/SpoT domain-containing protein [Aquimarina intermedia]TYP75261.1 RelA/SpoT family protein [Aquimarina intermedia]
MTYTGGDIRRLGDKIVESNGTLNENDLQLLQEYRKSFTHPLSETFNALTQIKNRVDRQGIIAFRLKRIKTIINKVLRNPDMHLNRMGDIAGIRIIVKTETQLNKIRDSIISNFEISGKIRDYNENPKPIEYKGVHIYVKDPKEGKRIEVQLRTIEAHNWATLVEITDLLYDTRLKELGYKNNLELGEFHALISREIDLSTSQAEHIYSVLDKYNYITKLSEVFRNNNNEVKKQWIKVKPRSRYFLIESSSNSIPKLEGFTDYNKAEEEYFKRYKKNQDALIVLTAIHKPSFEQISIAYANYILSYHNFMNDIEAIIKELAIEALEINNKSRFRKIFRTYEELQANAIFQIFTSAEEIFVNQSNNDKLILSSNRKISTRKQKALRKEIESELKKKGKSHREFMKDIFEIQGNKSIFNLRNRKFLRKHSRRVKKRLKALTVEFTTN